jgi:hypothetical protein
MEKDGSGITAERRGGLEGWRAGNTVIPRRRKVDRVGVIPTPARTKGVSGTRAAVGSDVTRVLSVIKHYLCGTHQFDRSTDHDGG